MGSGHCSCPMVLKGWMGREGEVLVRVLSDCSNLTATVCTVCHNICTSGWTAG